MARGAGGFGTRIRQVDIVVNFTKKGGPEIKHVTTELTGLTAATKRYTTTVRDQNKEITAIRGTTTTAIPSLRNMTMHIQAMNLINGPMMHQGPHQKYRSK